mgnify:CR=1 FL=1
MINILKSILNFKKLENKSVKNIQNISLDTKVYKIFSSIEKYSEKSEVRYVGGCIRKILNFERVDDIDLAANITPKEIIEVLKKNKINYYETGIDHGTITANIDGQNFEITSLRKDISTDGRHAKVEYSDNWFVDASRRDFTINSIYSDIDGNLYDPFNGREDLKNGIVKFIGEPNKRIKEDYLRILRYVRFFLNYSKHPHNTKIKNVIKKNINGIKNLSKERLLDELKKILTLHTIEKLSKDKISLELILMIFPEFRYLKIFSRLKPIQKNLLKEIDFVLFLSLITIDETDNADYFLYRFNLSKKDQKRIKIIDNFYKDKTNSKTFSEANMNKFFYYNGRQSTIDILIFKMVRFYKSNENITDLIKLYKNKITPIMPIKAEEIMNKYKISEGKQLGLKLKLIEKEWVNNNFQISGQQVDNIVKD